MAEAETRCGFVALIGEPNAGKSTLLNRLVGSKIAPVTHKVQTTRIRIMGIATKDESQIVFIDTPGIFEPRRRLDRAMVDAAWRGASDADRIMLVVDAKLGMDRDTARIVEGLKESKRTAALVLNKIDLLPPEERDAVENVAARDADTVAMSAVTGKNTDIFLHHLDELLSADRGVVKLRVPQADGAAISWLYRNADVLSRDDGVEHAELEVSISPDQLARFEKNHPIG